MILLNILGRLRFVVVALLAVSCSTEGRSLVPVDVTVASDIPGVASVEIRVSRNGNELFSQTFGFASPGSGPLRVGVYVPAHVSGPIALQAIGQDDQGTAIAESDLAMATVSPGKTSPTVVLTIVRRLGGVVVDGGVVRDVGGVVDVGGMPDLRLVVDASSADMTRGGVDVGITDGAAADRTPLDGSIDRSILTPDVAVAAPDVAPDVAPDFSVPIARTWKAGENIEKDLVSVSRGPAVAIDPIKNHALVVWQEETAIRVRRFDGATGIWGEIKTVEIQGEPLSPQIVTDPQGVTTIVWNQNSGGSMVDLKGLWESHSSDGLIWSAPTRIHMGPVYYDKALQVSRNGSLRVLWQESAMNINTLWTAYKTAGATTWSEIVPVKAATDTNERYPRLSMNANGGGVVLFNQRDVSPPSEDSVWASTFSGASLSPPVLVETYTTDSAYDADVAVNADGRGMATWAQRNGSTNADLWANIYTPGAGWGGPKKVLTGGWISNTAVVVDKAGVATVAWTQPLSVVYRDQVFAARHSPDTGWGAAEPLETNNKSELRTDQDPTARLGLDAAGNVHLVWRKKTDDMTTFGIYTRRFTIGMGWGPERMLGGKPKLKAWEHSVAVSDDGAAVSAFYFVDPMTTGDTDAFNTFAAVYR